MAFRSRFPRTIGNETHSAPLPVSALGGTIGVFHAPRKAVLVMCMVMGTLASGALAQTPSVSITNTTRGGHTVFYVGDSWTVSITGGAANAAVQVCIPGSCSPEGYTDGSGNYTLSGYMSSGDVGTWNETWSVGGVTATPDPLTFYVYPSSAASCNLSSGAVPPVMYSLDFIDAYSGYLVYQSLGSGTISATLDPSGYCLMYGDSWDIEWPIAGQRTILSNYVDQWAFWDTGARPLNLNGFYPYISGAVVGVVAINVTNGDFWIVNVPIGLYIDYTYW